MKKIALTSLLAVFAAAGANAANVIDGNPLYMPKAGHFYSETNLFSDSENTDSWTLAEEFGYGISDKLAVVARTDLAEGEGFDTFTWGNLALEGQFRALDMGAWKVDAIAGFGLAPVYAYDGEEGHFLEKEATGYTWTLGARGGYTTAAWTVAGHVMFEYANGEAFAWGDEGGHSWKFGVDGQYVIDSNWNLVAGLEYTGITDDGAKNAGTWEGKFGVNYNIDATKYLGAYISGAMTHATGDWEWADGFGFGVKFGIDF